MRETVLHYIWKNRLFDQVTLDGEALEILDVGQYNFSDGPDFSLAKVRKDNLTWVGSVEMHRKSSDWVLHKHQADPRYDRIILHVVLENDHEVLNSQNEPIPTAVLTIREDVLKRIDELEISSKALRCTPEISRLSPYLLRTLTAPLLIERLEGKIARNRAKEDFHVLFYRLLMRYLGAHQNNEVMEQIARATPLSYLRKHISDTEALESILLGQASLIADNPRDEYEERLRKRYTLYREKFDLKPIPGNLFKKLRVRPPAYPARVLSIAAQIIHREDDLGEAMSSCDFKRARELLAVSPSDYWRRHIDFGQSYPKTLGGISQNTINSLLINAVLPAAYHYNKEIGRTDRVEEILQHYGELPPESNQFIRLFRKNGFAAHSAGDTQRMLQLYTRYCETFGCFFCPLAPAILSALHKRDQ